MSSANESNPGQQTDLHCSSPATNSSSHASATSENGAASNSANGPTPADIECQRLLNEVARLEEERKRDRQLIETLEKDAIAYRHELHSWAMAQITPQDLERWALEETEEDCQELHEFIGELEAIVKGNADAKGH